MGFKRKKSDGEGEEMEAGHGGKSNFKVGEKRKVIIPSMIKNKEKRSRVYAKQKHEKKVEKQKRIKARDAAEKRALELGEEPPKRMIPNTLENTREYDETVCKPDDEELLAEMDADEFSRVLRREITPKIMITTNVFYSTRGPSFIDELLDVIPNSHYHRKGTYELKEIQKYAIKNDFTSVIVVHTNRREPNALDIIGLPIGPTAHFKLSKLVLRKDIKNHGNPTSHVPELFISHFKTRLGNRVGRLFQSLFPPDPDFVGRRFVTIKNQADFILFRHHRYMFETKESKNGVELKVPKQECGPQFNLVLDNLKLGIFDSEGGEVEWKLKPEMKTSRKKFHI